MGKPLISDAQMLAMHAAMLEIQQAAPRRAALAQANPWPVSLLAASLLQLRSDDLLITDGEQPLTRIALRSGQQSSFAPDLLPFTLALSAQAAPAVAAGYALAQSHGSRPGDHAPLTLALLSSQAGLDEVMRIAGEAMLPLLLVIRDTPNQPRNPIAAPANVEVVPVDAEDAVAVCRVMQESTLRARNRWGTVVLRAITLPNSTDPVEALGAHLRGRGLVAPSAA